MDCVHAIKCVNKRDVHVAQSAIAQTETINHKCTVSRIALFLVPQVPSLGWNYTALYLQHCIFLDSVLTLHRNSSSTFVRGHVFLNYDKGWGFMASLINLLHIHSHICCFFFFWSHFSSLDAVKCAQGEIRNVPDRLNVTEKCTNEIGFCVLHSNVTPLCIPYAVQHMLVKGHPSLRLLYVFINACLTSCFPAWSRCQFLTPTSPPYELPPSFVLMFDYYHK